MRFEVRLPHRYDNCLQYPQLRTPKTGNPKLKALEENVLVGSGRFIVESGTALQVEYNIGRLVAA